MASAIQIDSPRHRTELAKEDAKYSNEIGRKVFFSNCSSMHFSICSTFQGKTMIGQNVLLELVEGDKVQLYAYTSTGITDHKASHYTQFIGLLMRPSVDSLHEVVRRLGAPDLDEDVSVADNDVSVRSSASTVRGSVNGGGGEGGRRASRKAGGGGSGRIMSPPPQEGVGNGIHTLAISEEPEIQLERENRSKQEAKASKDKKVNEAVAPSASSPKSIKTDAKTVRNGAPTEISEKGEKPSNGKKAAGKDKSPKKGSVAELASSTLKGFSKM